jgi:peroxiredoxin
MGSKLKAGQAFPALHTRTIHGQELAIPDPGRWVHLQFRRFAGCPICNLHLQAFVRRHEEIVGADIVEVVVFHSTDAELLAYQGNFPFAVIGDPLKELYRRYGVETSLAAILHPAAWGAALKGNLSTDKPKMPLMPNGGILGLPADFLVAPDGTLRAAHYGAHADDHWSVDEVIRLGGQAP